MLRVGGGRPTPSLVVKVKLPLPPTVFFVTTSVPCCGFLVSVNVHVTVSPVRSVIAAVAVPGPMTGGVVVVNVLLPSSELQLRPVRFQSLGIDSVTVYDAVAGFCAMLNVAAPVPLEVVMVKLAGRPLPPVVVKGNVPSPPTVFFTILIWVTTEAAWKLRFWAPPLVPSAVSTPMSCMWIGAPPMNAAPLPGPQPPFALSADEARCPVQPSLTLQPAPGHPVSG